MRSGSPGLQRLSEFFLSGTVPDLNLNLNLNLSLSLNLKLSLKVKIL
jgi:hypothetical protein